MFTAIRRITRAGFVGFWRNAYVSLAAIFVISIVLFVIGATIFLEQLLNASLTQLKQRVDINVYFAVTAPQAEIDAVVNAVRAMPEVASVIYTSREDALREYRERYQDDLVALQALEALDENPLGANIAVQAFELSQYELVNRYLNELKAAAPPQSPVIESINYERNEEAIETLDSILVAVERGSLGITIFLLVAAVMITFNTIRLAIYTAREEIAIMRLVGASNMFIRGPFILQGVMYGFISGVLALLAWYPILSYLGPRTENFFAFNLFTYFVTDFNYLFAVLVGIGVVLGFTSSLLAIARYLKT